MFKLLIFILILYLGYRFLARPMLDQGRVGRIRRDNKDDDYTDYEEVR